MTRAPWPVMGSKSEQLLTRLTNATHRAYDLSHGVMGDLGPSEEIWQSVSDVLNEADEYLAGIGQFVDRMHRRDMGERV